MQNYPKNSLVPENLKSNNYPWDEMNKRYQEESKVDWNPMAKVAKIMADTGKMPTIQFFHAPEPAKTGSVNLSQQPANRALQTSVDQVTPMDENLRMKFVKPNEFDHPGSFNRA